MNIELEPVESQRFTAWKYLPAECELIVRFKPTSKKPLGALVAYSGVAPEIWEDALDAESKGAWLGREIIANPQTYPFRYIDDVPPPNGNPPVAAAVPPAPGVDETLIPETLRQAKPLPALPKLAVPEILPPDVQSGQKPFTQEIRERAEAIVAAVPIALQVSSPEAYKALGAALVNVKKERIAMVDAMELVARPLIDAKRNFDSFRNQVTHSLTTAEQRLERALKEFKRLEDQRIEREAARLREEQRARDKAKADEEARIENERIQREAAELKEAAERRLQEAQEALEAAQAMEAPTEGSEALFGADEGAVAASVIDDAQLEIARSQRDLAEAAEMEKTVIQPREVEEKPLVLAKTDLHVKGLRKSSPKWRWRIKAAALNRTIPEGLPISRIDMKEPDSIPAAYWILDQKAIGDSVIAMKGRFSLAGIETYDENA
jgi:hypothetical protein